MNPIEELKNLLMRFPGIGPRQAERFVYFLLHSHDSYKNNLANAIKNLQNRTRKCVSCERFFITEKNTELCNICSDKSRDKTQLLIVEKETDIDKIELSGIYNGIYFISQGTVTPLDDSEKHTRFLQRIKNKISTEKELAEIILAFSATFDGEYSLKYLKEELEKDFSDIKISFLGRGLSSGSEIEYADSETLRYALKNRF